MLSVIKLLKFFKLPNLPILPKSKKGGLSPPLAIIGSA